MCVCVCVVCMCVFAYVYVCVCVRVCVYSGAQSKFSICGTFHIEEMVDGTLIPHTCWGCSIGTDLPLWQLSHMWDCSSVEIRLVHSFQETTGPLDCSKFSGNAIPDRMCNFFLSMAVS